MFIPPLVAGTSQEIARRVAFAQAAILEDIDLLPRGVAEVAAHEAANGPAHARIGATEVQEMLLRLVGREEHRSLLGERVFAARSRWTLGETYALSLLIPAPPPRLDFHLPIREPRSVDPQVIDAQMIVEALEEIDLFGARVTAFRCRVEPPGMTLWVSPNGGVLRFDDGRGLTGALEP